MQVIFILGVIFTDLLQRRQRPAKRCSPRPQYEMRERERLLYSCFVLLTSAILPASSSSVSLCRALTLFTISTTRLQFRPCGEAIHAQIKPVNAEV